MLNELQQIKGYIQVYEQALPASSKTVDTLDTLRLLAQRFNKVARQLRKRHASLLQRTKIGWTNLLSESEIPLTKQLVPSGLMLLFPGPILAAEDTRGWEFYMMPRRAQIKTNEYCPAVKWMSRQVRSPN
ncbi:MAG TPA: hypothetical protein DC054_25530 [Blastocatellia bacterium]|nr:hypothetical protein [Blastocatellia bacterium]